MLETQNQLKQKPKQADPPRKEGRDMHTLSDKLMNGETLKLLYCFGTHLDKPQVITNNQTHEEED